MRFFEKHLIKLYLIAGTLFAYSFYIPHFIDKIVESMDEKGLLFTLIGLGFLVGTIIAAIFPAFLAELLKVVLEIEKNTRKD